MMIKKSDIVRALVKQQEYKKALLIAKDFRLGITPEQSNDMKMAYECMVHETFYSQLGRNIQETIDKGIDVLKGLYSQEC
ncbi:hypothetical protein SDC9_206982 [bioreactor metagenome]|uniref:Uncharacterized protein n=1 Tax=bioreactor metagenome TaxID=1076179 RepID=A0A645J6M0_9ZZZZ